MEVSDTIAPPEVLSPANGGTVQTPTTTISGIAEAGSTVTLTITGTASSTETTTTNGTGQFATAPLALADGVYQVSAVATNAVPKTSGAMPASTFTHGVLPVTQPGITLVTGGLTNSGVGVNKVTTQTDTLTNTSGFAIPGPVYLVLDSLVAGAPFLSAKDAAGAAMTTGTTTRTPLPTGSPYVQVVGPAGSLAPGAVISVVLKFSNPSTLAITYTGRILSGGTVTP